MDLRVLVNDDDEPPLNSKCSESNLIFLDFFFLPPEAFFLDLFFLPEAFFLELFFLPPDAFFFVFFFFLSPEVFFVFFFVLFAFFLLFALLPLLDAFWVLLDAFWVLLGAFLDALVVLRTILIPRDLSATPIALRKLRDAFRPPEPSPGRFFDVESDSDVEIPQILQSYFIFFR